MAVRSDLDARLTYNSSINPQAIASNTTVNGASSDLTAVAPGCRVYVTASVGSRTDGTYTFTVQDSADNSSFADASVYSGSLAAISAANTNRTASFVPAVGRPYVRVKVTSTSVTTGGVVAANIFLAPPAMD